MKHTKDFISHEQAENFAKATDKMEALMERHKKLIPVEVKSTLEVCVGCLWCDHHRGTKVVKSSRLAGLMKKEEWENYCEKLSIPLPTDEYMETHIEESPCKFKEFAVTLEIDDVATITYNDVLQNAVVHPKMQTKAEYLKEKYGI